MTSCCRCAASFLRAGLCGVAGGNGGHTGRHTRRAVGGQPHECCQPASDHTRSAAHTAALRGAALLAGLVDAAAGAAATTRWRRVRAPRAVRWWSHARPAASCRPMLRAWLPDGCVVGPCGTSGPRPHLAQPNAPICNCLHTTKMRVGCEPSPRSRHSGRWRVILQRLQWV
jgi:hypothetical protein